jgi:hypothetical protein
MAKTFTITLPDNLEQAVTDRAEQLNQSPEVILLQALTKQLINTPHNNHIAIIETDPLIQLIGSLDIDIPDLAENHDRYIAQDLLQELNTDA